MKVRIFSLIVLLCAIYNGYSNEISPEQDLITLTSATSVCQVNTTSTNVFSLGDYLSNLTTTEHWPARWTCGDWSETEGWMYIGADIMIFLAYLSIPIMLLFFMFKMKFGKYKLFIGLFALFIISCGVGHLLDALLFWEPMYRLSGAWMLITASLSWATVFALVKAIPVVLSMKDTSEFNKEVSKRRETENILNTFFKYSPTAQIMLDDQLYTLAASDRFINDYQLRELDFIGKPFYDLFPSLESNKIVHNHLSKALNGEPVSVEKFKIHTADDQVKYIRYELLPWYDDTEEVKGIIISTEEITEKVMLQKSNEAKARELQETNKLLLKTYELAKIGSYEFDPETEKESWGQNAMSSILEIEDAEEFYRIDSMNQLLDEYHYKLFIECHERALHQLIPYDIELLIKTPKGNKKWIRAIGNPIVNDQNELIKVQGFRQDITDLKEAEITLIEHNILLEKKVDQRTKEYKEVNIELQGAYDSLKKSQNQLIEAGKMASIGQLVAGVAHEINTPMGAIKASVDNIESAKVDALNFWSSICSFLDQKYLPIFNEFLLATATGNKQLSTKEERTLRKEIKQALAEMDIENTEALAQSLSIMQVSNIKQYEDILTHPKSHEIVDATEKFTSLFRNASTIKLAVDKCSKIVFALKNFSRRSDETSLQKASLEETIETVVTIYQNQFKQGIELVRDYQCTPQVYCNQDQLSQVWTNLIHNAIQAMNFKGQLSIVINEDTDHYYVRIGDNGAGIPESIKESIFKPFFTTKGVGEGSGLGLDIVRKIVSAHHGEITFESKPGQTIFTVKLPKEPVINVDEPSIKALDDN